MVEYLRKDLVSLTNLSYDNIKVHLLTKGVITDNEKQQIDKITININQMDKLIEIVQMSLLMKQTIKFKVFPQAMEECDDLSLAATARRLGKQLCTPITNIESFRSLNYVGARYYCNKQCDEKFISSSSKLHVIVL